jgi:hypothetical protein
VWFYSTVSFGIGACMICGAFLHNQGLWSFYQGEMSNKTTMTAFDQHQFEGYPPPGTLVLCISRFATIEILRF